ncbi:MAG TPA: hypothetical protein VGH56_00920 [Solirubrobacteraceae bacterium]
MAKLNRETRLRERRLEKQARKIARKDAVTQVAREPDDHPPSDPMVGDPAPNDG